MLKSPLGWPSAVMRFQEALPAVDPVAQAKAQASASRKSGIFQGVFGTKNIEKPKYCLEYVGKWRKVRDTGMWIFFMLDWFVRVGGRPILVGSLFIPSFSSNIQSDVTTTGIFCVGKNALFFWWRKFRMPPVSAISGWWKDSIEQWSKLALVGCFTKGIIYTCSISENNNNLRKFQQTPGTYPKYGKNPIWKDSLHKQVVQGLGYVPRVCWNLLRNKPSQEPTSILDHSILGTLLTCHSFILSRIPSTSSLTKAAKKPVCEFYNLLRWELHCFQLSKPKHPGMKCKGLFEAPSIVIFFWGHLFEGNLFSLHEAFEIVDCIPSRNMLEWCPIFPRKRIPAYNRNFHEIILP